MSSTKLVLGVVIAVASGCGGVDPPADATPPRDVVCGSSPIEVLPNGGFDDSSPLWTQDPVTPSFLCDMSVIMPASGTKAACLGNTDGTVRTLTQQIKLPAGAKSVTISGQRCISTQETATADNDVLSFELLDGSTVISSMLTLSNQQGVAACEFSSFTATKPVTADPIVATLRLRSTLDSARTTTFFIDSLSLKVSCQ